MEGGLARPVRHNIDWKNPDYLNEDLFEKELRRVADACHGCRRCVSLCNSFPSLFDLIDESDTFEVDGVEYSQFEEVVDHWFSVLCNTIADEATPLATDNAIVKEEKREDGKTEIS